MAVSSIACQMGVTASPISAATAATIAITAANGPSVSLVRILMVTIPACFIGMLVAATWSVKRGKELARDPRFQEKMADPALRSYIQSGQASVLGQEVTKNAKRSLNIFLVGVIAIIIVAMFSKRLLPITAQGAPIPMSVSIQFIMLAVGATILFATRIRPKAISDAKVFNAGMVAVIMIFGIAWMSDTVIGHNKPYIIDLIAATVRAHPWTFALAMFSFSAFLKSQAAVLSVMLPLGFELGLPIETLIGSIPACYAYFFFCFYPTDLAAINFDRTGTTHIGRYIFNHSFMIPGLIGVDTASATAMLLAKLTI